MIDADLAQHLARDRELIGHRGIGRVDDVEQDVGLAGLVERRPKRRDEIVRQLLDEADGVADEDRRLGRRCEATHRGVERRE